MFAKKMTLHNKFFVRLILIYVGGYGSSVSFAADWIRVGRINSQFGPSVVEIDSSSIRKFTDTPEQEELEFQQLYTKVRSAWFRLTFSPTDIKGQTVSSARIRLAVNCDIKVTQTERMIVYSGAQGTGKILASSSERSLWVGIVPDSLADLAHGELC